MSDDLAHRRILRKAPVPAEQLTFREIVTGWVSTLTLKDGKHRRDQAWSKAHGCALADAGDGSLLYISFRNHRIVHLPTMAAPRA